MDNFVDVLGVRITPKIINFNNCVKDESYIRVINVQNISSKSVTVRFYPPQLKNFSLISKNHEKVISSGLSHVCSLRYTMDNELRMSDRLVITVDGVVHEVEINIYPSASDLTIADQIDFGTVVMANKVINRQIEITNNGMKMGEFKLVYEGNKPLNIVPSEGFVYPQSSTTVQIEFVTREAQEISELCHVFFEGQDSFTIKICGEVVKRSLELLDLSTDERKRIQCIKFPNTYYGSDRSEAALLFNNSPEKIQYVAILEEDTVGQESGSHITMTASGINPKECTNALTSLITMFPNQGSLGPYEKIPVLFRFSPRWKLPKQAFKKTLEPPLQQKFAVFVKIQIVGSGMEVDSNLAGKEKVDDSLAMSQQLEVAVTGTANPVLIELKPNELNLGQCVEGESTVQTITICNRSSTLPCLIDLPRIAHFSTEPKFLKIPANEKIDLSVVFCPKQIGEFKTKQIMNVLSFVKDPNNPFIEYEEAIHELFFNLYGSCVPTPKTTITKYCNGLDPLVTNSVGLSADTNFADLGRQARSGPISSYITTNAFASGGTKGSNLFKCEDSTMHPYNSRTAMVAFPNDRAASIRPSEQHKEYRTIMTRTKRHNYVDPDYAYEEEEMRKQREHKDVYGTYIRRRHLLKKISTLNSKFESYENGLNLGIIPGNKLTPPKIKVEEIINKKSDEPRINSSLQLLSSKELKQSDKVIDINKLQTFNAVPTSNLEKEQCTIVLTPQQLHKIVIGPSTVNFGDVCIRSTSNRDISVVNNLDQFIHVAVMVDCKELRQSSPLSQVIPAKTKSTFPLVFESSKKGKFQRNLSYVINGYYQNHVIVLSNVVPNQLQLSTDCLFLTSTSIQPPDTGMRSTITMTNPLNYATEFLWEPVFHSSGGIAFSIRPKEGVVEAFSKLDCEVVFHPSFMASSEGDFILRSPGNEENSIEISTEDTVMTDNSPANSPEPRSNISLHCVAMLGNPHVALQSRRVMFGNIPINLTTFRTAVLVNTGTNHAFYRVVSDEVNLKYPGMVIAPLKGSVPVGGQSEITIKYLPKSLMKFDFSVPVVIRGWKEIELKISGAVIIPQVEIVQKRLEFGGVAVGSERIIDFTLCNKSQCRALLEFDFSKQRDFSLLDENVDRQSYEARVKCLYEMQLKPMQSLDCKLLFAPREVAAYDFPLAITINQIDMNSVDDSRSQTNNSITTSKVSKKISNAISVVEKSPTKTQPQISSNLNRQVTATAIRQPISISSNTFSFLFTEKSQTQNGFKKLIIYNNMITPVELCLKLSAAEWKFGSDNRSMKRISKSKIIPFVVVRDDERWPLTEDLTATLCALGEAIEVGLSFAPEIQGFYSAEFPIYLNNDFSHPYQRIHITGSLESARLICQPESLIFLPAPLATELSINFKILAINFDCDTQLEIRLPTVLNPVTNEEYQPFRCALLTKNEIRAMSSQAHASEIRVKLTFCSDIPINIRSSIMFTTDCGVSKNVALHATADNCTLSWQTFINRHQMEYHIVCEEGKTLEGTETGLVSGLSEFGEAQLKQLNKTDSSVVVPRSNQSSHSRNSTTVTSSNFEESSVTYEETMSESESAYLSTPLPLREGALNNIGEKNRDENYKLSTTPSVKIHQKSGAHRLSRDGSNSNTLDIGSSIVSDKESSVPNNGVEEFSTETASNTNESNLYSDIDIPTSFDPELILVVQRWFSMHGWPGNIHPINIPVNFRTSLQKRFGHSQTSSKDKTIENNENMENTGLKSDSRDFYDMILFLSGRQILGINTTVCLPTNPIERSCHIYIQHATLIAFIESQGAQLAQVLPEYLMDTPEYELWHSNGCPGLANKDDRPIKYEAVVFDKISKKAWTTVLLQIIKVFILVKINYKSYRHALQVLHTKNQLPDVHQSPIASNCYSVPERIILAWLNYLYDTYRSKVWPESKNSDIGVAKRTPPARWIINFDNDFMDSLVLATALAAYVPFLGESHFRFMYCNPQNPEQCLHNALKVVNALKEIGVEFDIQAIDIVDPNPIMMMLLSQQLFQTLPLYLPKSEISFTGALHEHVTKNIQISNPTSKPLTYECIIIGNDASDFSSPKGNIVNVTGKGSVKWPIVFKSRFLRCAEALIMFIGRKTGSVTASNLIFTAKSKITSNNPSKIEKISEKCYVLKRITLKIASPYNKAGEFRVKLVENISNTTKPTKEPVDDSKSPLQIQMKSTINKKNGLESLKTQNKLRAFFCHCQSVYIDDSRSGLLELFYLPFHLGVKSCSIIFTHDTIGEFVHYVEATAELPEPIRVISKIDGRDPEKKSVRVSSADAASRGFEGNDNVIYWKCEVGSTVDEIISVPINNPHKENALLTAAQKHLSPQEVSRRKITGTLNSSSLLLTAIQVLTLASTETADQISTKEIKKTIDTKYSNKGSLLDFEIELSSSFFTTPARIQIPDSIQYSDTDSTKESAPSTKTVDIPIKFVASTAGVYPCDVLLKGADDVRLYRIECTVVPEGNCAQLFFKAPIQDVLIQNIPVVNKTKQDWPLRATIAGTSAAFSGPEFVMAKALTVSQYALQFKPTKEGKINAKLSLYNEADGTEHIFELFGEGESPLALETLNFECNVGETVKRMLQIPNSTRKKHVFSVESDLDSMMIGEDSVSVLPGRSSPYELTLTPNASGDYKGILAFISGKKKIIEYDSDGDELQDVFPEEKTGSDDHGEHNGQYRIWYSINVKVHKGPPVDTFTIQCHCLQTTSLEIPITNPLVDKDILIRTSIQGPNLSGEKSVNIKPGSTSIYSLVYKPSRIGQFDGRLIFFDEYLGEFWYKVRMVSKPPLETEIPVIDCCLGKWGVVEIPLTNLDAETILYIHPEVSNPECFNIHIQDLEWFDHQQQRLCIPPMSERILGVRFTPCTIGSDAHDCVLTLKSDMLGDWKFKLTGCGLPPKPCDVIGISAEAGSNMTLLIPFHNPLLETVLIDVKITEEHQSLLDRYRLGAGNTNQDSTDVESAIFKLLLKNNKKLKLDSKQSFEIPISFAPQEMRGYDAICSVVMRKRNGEAIISEEDFDNLIIPNTEVPSAHDRFTLRWLFPIKGIPEASAPANAFTTPLVQGPLRIESRERIELCLWGLPPAVSGEDYISKKTRSASQKHPDHDNIKPLDPLLQEFTTELKAVEQDQNEHIDSRTLNESVNMFLMKESKHVDTGMTILTFEIRFKPMKKFRSMAQLRVTSTSGGVWLFPIRFIAHECEPDDEIVMEAIGLNKPVSVKFHLNSKSFEALSFKAYFLKGGDIDFSVSPESGVLPSIQSRPGSGQTGLPFVVTWTPKTYNRCKGAKLVIETEKMEWVYKFTGINPQYIVPHSNSMLLTRWPSETEYEVQKKDIRKKNFIRQNLDLTCTAVSSPIKGAPLFPKIA